MSALSSATRTRTRARRGGSAVGRLRRRPSSDRRLGGGRRARPARRARPRAAGTVGGRAVRHAHGEASCRRRARCRPPRRRRAAGQLADQRQADARPLVAARPRAADPVEAVEQPGQLVGGDADAGVGDLQPDAVVVATPGARGCAPAKVNFRALESRFVTIFSQWSGSTATGRGSGGQSTSSAQPAALDGGAEAARDCRGERGQVDGLQRGRRPRPPRRSRRSAGR